MVLYIAFAKKNISFVGMYLVYHLVYVILHCFFQFLGNVSCKIPRITWWYVKNQTKRKKKSKLAFHYKKFQIDTYAKLVM